MHELKIALNAIVLWQLIDAETEDLDLGRLAAGEMQDCRVNRLG